MQYVLVTRAGKKAQEHTARGELIEPPSGHVPKRYSTNTRVLSLISAALNRRRVLPGTTCPRRP